MTIDEEIEKCADCLQRMEQEGVENDGLRSRVARLEAEIADLRASQAWVIDDLDARVLKAERDKLKAENAELRARCPDDVASGKRLFCDSCNAAWVADGESCCCCKEPFGDGT